MSRQEQGKRERERWRKKKWTHPEFNYIFYANNFISCKIYYCFWEVFIKIFSWSDFMAEISFNFHKNTLSVYVLKCCFNVDSVATEAAVHTGLPDSIRLRLRNSGIFIKIFFVSMWQTNHIFWVGNVISASFSAVASSMLIGMGSFFPSVFAIRLYENAHTCTHFYRYFKSKIH